MSPPHCELHGFGVPKTMEIVYLHTNFIASIILYQIKTGSAHSEQT